MQIVVVGMGYVGLSIAAVLAQRHQVVAVDLDRTKVDLLNSGLPPIVDSGLTALLATRTLNLVATTDAARAYEKADYVVIATPTNYDEGTQDFDTTSVDSVIHAVQAVNTTATAVIKSTVPVGFTRGACQRHPHGTIIFSPEFLREGNALRDNLYPSRIIVGDRGAAGHGFAKLLAESALSDNVPILLTGPDEAEAIKLFSNAYLATRVAFFNELDTFAASRNLQAAEIVDGVGLDPRIGNHYNNPSFGYGGYCLPKDTKQLVANYAGVPQALISAVVKANETRKRFIAENILRTQPSTVGVYRLVMKAGADNFRESSVIDVIRLIEEAGVEVVVYEPLIKGTQLGKTEVTRDLQYFQERSDIILANRTSPEISNASHKVYTRDIYGRD